MRLISALVAVALLIGSASAVASQPASPPIEAGEIYIETAYCGYVIKASDLAPGNDLAKYKADAFHDVWYGRCVDGLIDGEGQFASIEGEFPFARSEYVLGRPQSADRQHSVFFGKTDYSGLIAMYDGPKPFGPRWAWDGQKVWGSREVNGSLDNIEAQDQRCMDDTKTQKFSGCRYSNNYRVYTFKVWLNGKQKQFYCPDPRTPEGCDNAWLAAGKPIFDQIRAVTVPTDARLAATRRRYEGLITPGWRAQFEAKHAALVNNGTPEQLRDLVAASAVAGDMDEALRLQGVLSRRFPNSSALNRARMHLLTAACVQAAVPRQHLWHRFEVVI